jgi:hypothetical protein
MALSRTIDRLMGFDPDEEERREKLIRKYNEIEYFSNTFHRLKILDTMFNQNELLVDKPYLFVKNKVFIMRWLLSDNAPNEKYREFKIDIIKNFVDNYGNQNITNYLITRIGNENMIDYMLIINSAKIRLTDPSSDTSYNDCCQCIIM